MAARPALFFDRDGTLSDEMGYRADPDRLKLLPGARRAVLLARAAGFLSVLVSNQSGVARGLFSLAEVEATHRALARRLGGLDGVYVCPHHPSEGQAPWRCDCPCRKPRPGLLLRARDELGLSLERSVLVGDHLRDLEAARAVKARAVLVLTGHGRSALAEAEGRGLAPDHVAADVLAAVRWAVGREEGA
jgi:D-glycero-D-manno-heptose 1,7-bisphosphate phosphatase